jgi:hypothetical protein
MNALDVLEFLVSMIGVLWLLTGCAIWLRWGCCGVLWIWRRRKDIDAAVELDLNSQGFRVVRVEESRGQ